MSTRIRPHAKDQPKGKQLVTRTHGRPLKRIGMCANNSTRWVSSIRALTYMHGLSVLE